MSETRRRSLAEAVLSLYSVGRAEAIRAARGSFSLSECCVDSVLSLSGQAVVASKPVRGALCWLHFAVGLPPPFPREACTL